METATRDRLTGAVILVAAAAILVPEMLSGPGDRGRANDQTTAERGEPALTTYELPLGPSNGAALPAPLPEPAPVSQAGSPPVTAPGAATPLPGAQGAASPPSPATSSSGSPPAGASAAPAAGEPDNRTADAAAAPPSAPAQSGSTTSAPSHTRLATPAPPGASASAEDWWVQLGSFSSEYNAQGLASRMRAKGFTIQVSKVNAGGRELFRVRAGPVKSREAAVALKDRLAAAGQQGTLVAP